MVYQTKDKNGLPNWRLKWITKPKTKIDHQTND